MYDAITISNIIKAAWIEANPAAIDVSFTVDEFDPKNPAIQILVEPGPVKNEYMDVGTIIKQKQSLKISVYIKPVRYADNTLTTAKTTFYNALAEVDRILRTIRYTYAPTEITADGWRLISIPKGFGTQAEPLIFTAEQMMFAEIYNGGSAAVLTGKVVSLVINSVTITNCKYLRWKSNHNISPRLLPSSKIPVGWLQSHKWIEGEFGLLTLSSTVDGLIPATLDSVAFTTFVANALTTIGGAVVFTFTGGIVVSVDKVLENDEPVFNYRFLAYSVAQT